MKDPQSVLVNNWSITYPVCSWIGISCGAGRHRVTALNLSTMGLQGTIPPHLGNLSFLVYLNISHNKFHGHLPNELGQLRRLRFFSVTNNTLSGSFPPWIGTLIVESLSQQLQRSHPRFTLQLSSWTWGTTYCGNIPSKIGELSNLNKLLVENTYLSGSIPWSLYNISSLERIDLSSNSLSGTLPNDMCIRLPKLETLYLGASQFFGHIPSSLSECTRLQILWLSDNQFTGRLPENIGNLSKLMVLGLGKNNLQVLGQRQYGRRILAYANGNIDLLWLWKFWYKLVILNLGAGIDDNNIVTLEFYGNDVGVVQYSSRNFKDHFAYKVISATGGLYQEIGNLQSLENLDLGPNNLSGSIPPTIFNISTISLINLFNNQLSGHLPSTIGHSLPNLELFSLAKNKLTGTIPNSITNASKLTILDLSFNSFSGLIPNTFGNLRFLHMLNLANNNLTIESSTGGWSFLSSLSNCRDLTSLAFASNPLHGLLPSSIGNFSASLQNFFAYNCKLKGSIPQELEIYLFGHIPQCLASLISLRALNLDFNKLTSSIPSSFWSLDSLLFDIQNLKFLIELDLSRNQLSGDIPMTIGGLKDLATLSLAANKFHGPIPKSFGSLISLESLDLSSNNLYGEIPKSLEALLYLKQLNVSQNRLEGEIPVEGPFRNFSTESFSWNYALCGPSRFQVPPCKEENNKRSKKVALLVLNYILPPIISIMLLLIAIIVYVRCQNRSTKKSDEEDLLPLVTWRRISYLDIQRATDEFDECNLLGIGSFGSVYKGTLSDGTNVAIKIFNLQLERTFVSFNSECEVLRNVRHRNLIKILSGCSNLDFKALVLEFMPNGSLEKWLYSHNYFLDILERLNIMTDVGLALEYLHHGHALAPIIHCDLKPSNILLDENIVTHVSDFGISKLLGEGDDSLIQDNGYHWLYGTGYGILLLETFSRKKPTNDLFTREMSLKHWVNQSLPHKLAEVVDSNLVRQEHSFSAKMDCLLSIMNLALDCCMESPDERIHMTNAAAKLRKIKVQFLDDVAKTN
ncbi:hypothetical protein CUMW_113020 [Citrus unshiu]|uniref:Protein kinase domain-containing protein n=1 Tax=Citrus unshiu TaxID=55188 RepID=A0A2H5P8C5_CITUN|nr:hypothetical protein CUMW_113020 [Citrus unshiu]